MHIYYDLNFFINIICNISTCKWTDYIEENSFSIKRLLINVNVPILTSISIHSLASSNKWMVKKKKKPKYCDCIFSVSFLRQKGVCITIWSSQWENMNKRDNITIPVCILSAESDKIRKTKDHKTKRTTKYNNFCNILCNCNFMRFL